MKKRMAVLLALTLPILLASAAMAAYHHEGEKDSPNFVAAYPLKAGTKLDQCSLCHSGGKNEKNVEMGSCQWCHYKYGYDGSGDIKATLNAYGTHYLDNGRSKTALQTIEQFDSDGDGYSNIVEINALRYPGSAADDPSKVSAPFQVFTKAQLEALPQHKQFMLMNTSRSGDFYAEYSGVTVQTLLETAGVSPSATGITVFSPDGFSNNHPLQEDTTSPSLYHVYGVYPAAAYQYNLQADTAQNQVDGWCDYSAPSCAGYKHNDSIVNSGGLRLLLAFKREGTDLEKGLLTSENKLDGEGPFRVVPPQKVPCPPDQSSKAANQSVVWPYKSDWDHNAGFSSRTVTMIRVEPLPEGATDIDILEAGWNYVDTNQILVYGAIDPSPTAALKLAELTETIKALPLTDIKKAKKSRLAAKVKQAIKKAQKGDMEKAIKILNTQVLNRTDGCIVGASPDKTDWIVNSDTQKSIYWSVHDIISLLQLQ